MSTTHPFRSSAAQTTRVLLALRELILSGDLAASERLSEVALVERLGASRTPVRAALQRLAEEGLVHALPGGGYAVQAFGERDVDDAIELRGTLEGLAARLAAERGADPALLAQAQAVLVRIDQALSATTLREEDFARYVSCNERLHALLIEMADSSLLRRECARISQLPFASANSFVLNRNHAAQILRIAQEQHRQVLDAIQRRQGARAEALMREHARVAQRNFHDALHEQETLGQVSDSGLLRYRLRA
ncbi:GntR family transcriptional regulator [Xanthomonas sp. MUS 060]|uniref:GntR family transcriptional regulator n=1 Tax=Xanthomonas sp. MUS 060 TaxID=1588031 RepID=UPI0005F27EB0|nr:GntR family transcriptional regulator [Xanthomonas sp. MUS 060]